jgi:hypothetical protein
MFGALQSNQMLIGFPHQKQPSLNSGRDNWRQGHDWVQKRGMTGTTQRFLHH